MRKTMRIAGIFLAIMMLFTLTSCTPKTAEKGKEKIFGLGADRVSHGVRPADLLRCVLPGQFRHGPGDFCQAVFGADAGALRPGHGLPSGAHCEFPGAGHSPPAG